MASENNSEGMSRKSSLGSMLKPEIKLKYKENFTLGINLETKRTHNLPDKTLSLVPMITIDCGSPLLENLNFWG